ncbi:unnamed protein product [Trifolium pratense]|uniref:Uncharacterized protein n=1 Tax=Trifolium pratense TaxID=57577 RepID=A0ACB0K076_TRIPR|nr:unnamed protein product [Trifolium pratense]
MLNAYSNIVPKQPLDDRFVWRSSKDGNLTANQAYEFFFPAQQRVDWTAWLWHVCVPPSASFIAWRCFHNKMPTDENLMHAQGLCRSFWL